MVIEAAKNAPETKNPGPSMATWSAEVDMLASIADEIRALRYVTTAVNSKNKPAPPVPYARPQTAFERIRRQNREAAHKSLVARVLPHKKP